MVKFRQLFPHHPLSSVMCMAVCSKSLQCYLELSHVYTIQHGGQSETSVVAQFRFQFSKHLECRLGSEPHMHSSEVSPGVHTTFSGVALPSSLPSVISPAFFSSLGPPFTVLLLEAGALVFLLSCVLSATVSPSGAKQWEEERAEFTPCSWNSRSSHQRQGVPYCHSSRWPPSTHRGCTAARLTTAWKERKEKEETLTVNTGSPLSWPSGQKVRTLILKISLSTSV